MWGARRVALTLALSGPALAAWPARAQHDAEAAPSAGEAASFPTLPDDGRPSRQRDALLLVAEGLEGIARPAALRARLAAALGRPVLSLAQVESEASPATLWLSVDDKQVTMRLSTPPRPDLWGRVARAKLGRDPVATIVDTLLDMLWSERTQPPSEMRDPFCPAGTVCGGAQGRRPTEQNVLDPWDGGYARFDRGAPPPARGDAWEREQPAAVSQSSAVAPAAAASPEVAAPAPAPRDRPWAIATLIGAGFYGAGAFARYELSALRRFERVDLGLSFIVGRGQPDASEARRAIAALCAYRWRNDEVEIDLGGNLGLFLAERTSELALRPYLRGFGTFAIPTGTPWDVLIQSELGTTFKSVGETGAVEFALSLGTRLGLPP